MYYMSSSVLAVPGYKRRKENMDYSLDVKKDKKRVSEVIGNGGEMPAEGCLERGKSRLSCLRLLSFARCQ